MKNEHALCLDECWDVASEIRWNLLRQIMTGDVRVAHVVATMHDVFEQPTLERLMSSVGLPRTRVLKMSSSEKS